MRWIYLICFTLTSTGLLALFGVKPRDFSDAVFQFRRKVPTLTDELNVLTGKPERGGRAACADRGRGVCGDGAERML